LACQDETAAWINTHPHPYLRAQKEDTMTDTETSHEVGPEIKKAVVTKRDVTALLDGFKPEPPKVESPAEKERAKRLAKYEAAVRNVAVVFEELGGPDGTVESAAAALKALVVVLKKGEAAIAGISDAKLVPGVKAAPSPRAAKPTPEPEKAPEPEADATPEPPDVDAAIVAAGGRTSGPPAAARTPRSGPAATPPAPVVDDDPRGDEDPNLGDGF
jgi:hypothetical protein